MMTDCPIWLNLCAHYRKLQRTSLKKLFQTSQNRFEKLSCEVAGIFVDYSKNWLTEETMQLLCTLAIERKLPKAISDLFSGKKINTSEQRAALHMALRSPSHETLVMDDSNIVNAVHAELKKMSYVAQLLSEKKLLGFSGKPIDTILHVGVGGSGLGPALYHQAMQGHHKNATCYFLTEFDYVAICQKLAVCNPETTIAIIVSKSFTTQETLMICDTIMEWLTHAAQDNQKILSQLFAVTEKMERAIARGFLSDHIFKIWDWVGGRYSIWSAVSVSVVMVFGMDCFKRFLQGAHQVDHHFQRAPFEKNLPVILALIAIGYNNFFHTQTNAIVPYSAKLNLLPAYLQQLHMESLGKNINSRGEKISYATGRVIWGDVGPASQHSFHQLLMQGTQMIPVDFVLTFDDAKLTEYDVRRAAYCLSQSHTLLQGVMTNNAVQSIAGNRPSTTMWISHFTPETFGALLALYEHKVFVKSVVWGINAFDQWGVEHGKSVANALLFGITQNTISEAWDSSTRGLLEKIIKRVTT